MSRRHSPDTATGRGLRRWAAALALVLLGWLGWHVAIDMLATAQSANDPEAALRWRDNNPSLLSAVANKRLADAKDEKDLEAVENLARKALNASPLSQPALQVLGLTAAVRGDAKDARSLLELAGKRSLHDTVTQVWLLNASVRDQRWDDALALADIVLRTRDDVGQQLLPALATIAADESGRSELIAVLKKHPPWRGWLLRYLPLAAEPTVTYATLIGLEGDVRDDELQPLIEQMVSVGNFQLAYLAWLRFLPADRATQGGLLYNGDFSSPPSNIAFDWVLSPAPGVLTKVVDTGDPERGPALRVTFSNTRSAYSNTSKLLLLRPGTYRLSGAEHAENLVTGRGMAWRIYCATGDRQKIAESEPLLGTVDWREFSTQFEVPGKNCEAQWLKLENAAQFAVDQQIAGEVWFDHLQVTPVSLAVTYN